MMKLYLSTRVGSIKKAILLAKLHAEQRKRWALAGERTRARERTPIYLALVVACKFTVVGGRGFTGPYKMVYTRGKLFGIWRLQISPPQHLLHCSAVFHLRPAKGSRWVTNAVATIVWILGTKQTLPKMKFNAGSVPNIFLFIQGLPEM